MQSSMLLIGRGQLVTFICYLWIIINRHHSDYCRAVQKLGLYVFWEHTL
jgi:hypothetical protein